MKTTLTLLALCLLAGCDITMDDNTTSAICIVAIMAMVCYVIKKLCED